VELDASAREHGLAMIAAMSSPPSSVHVSSWDDCAESLAELYRRVLE
jgi:hypothetical protein